ncbi:Cerato-platanin [Chiua virens]|nr:Cerato-platanin [Chiua virens]
MKFISSLAILSAAVLPCLAQSVKVTYVGLYDDPSWPMDSTACSNGVNGLASKWPTLGDIPGYPLVAAIPGLTWNSTLCGTCWDLSYADGVDGTFIAVDAAYSTFNIAEYVFNDFAPGAVQAGSFEATATQVPCEPLA